jgi:hypothetical protein
MTSYYYLGLSMRASLANAVCWVPISALLILLSTGTVQSANRQPLLMEGKTSLYQKVLTRPSAILTSRNADGSFGNDTPLAPFTMLHVYKRLTRENEQWLEVGSGSDGKIDGWVRANQAIDWKQSIVAVFGNPAGRNRLPLYRDRGIAEELLASESAISRNNDIVAVLAQGNKEADFPAVSIEPENYIDFRDNFYLLPILDAVRFRSAQGYSMRLLQVASIPERASLGEEMGDEKGQRSQGFKTAIAFVMDATTSMGPYIERTREAIKTVYDRLEENQLTDRVGFAMVAFRDSVVAVPELEYVTRVVSDFRDGNDRDRLMSLVQSVKPATTSSRQFREDAYAGVKAAIDHLNWNEYAGRFIVLITDAPPRESADPLSDTGFDAARLRSLAVEKGIAVYVLHLLTPEGRATHDKAQYSYTLLSLRPEEANPYYAVPAGDPQELGQAVDAVAAQLVTQVGCLARHDQTPCDFDAIGQTAAKEYADKPELARLQEDTARIGHAMALAYFGREQGTVAPDLFTAWIADRDISHPDRQALEIRVLLTKNQLSDLQEGLKAIVVSGEKGQLSPKDFFDEIRSAAASFVRTPEKGIRGRFKNLAESGLLSEFLDGLPYRSQVLTLTQELWESWSIGEQQEFLDVLQAKIRLYKRYHDDVDQWRSLGHVATAGDSVYPIPLDDMP